MPKSKIDFITLIKNYLATKPGYPWEVRNGVVIKHGFNNLTSEEDKLIEFTTFLLKEIKQIKSNQHICNGGTCGYKICPKIGQIVSCDYGCMYPGA